MQMKGEREMKHHYLKTDFQYFEAIRIGLKSFEARKNDRGYQVGDILHLKEMVNGEPTGRVLSGGIIYILHGPIFGIEDGHCVMQLEQHSIDMSVSMLPGTTYDYAPDPIVESTARGLAGDVGN